MKFIVAGFVLFFLTPVIQARSISWLQAVELTEKNSSELQAAQATYDSIKILELGGASGFLPHLSGRLRGTENGSTSGTTSFSYSAGLSLTQNIFAGFADYSTFQLKKANSEQALIDLQLTRARISQELKQVFAETYYAQENIKLSESILKRRKENLRSVQLQYDVGRENKGSLLLSQANVDAADLDLLHAKNDAEVSIENFRKYTGLPSEEEVILESNIEKENPAVSPDFKQMAFENLTVKKQILTESISSLNADISRAKFIPSLDFSADYNYSDTKYFPENDSWSLGLVLTVPLFDGLRDYSSFRSEKFKLQSARLGSGTTLQAVLSDLKRAFYDFVEALQTEKVASSFNQAATLRAEIARSKYKNGLLSFEDWDLIESNLIDKQKNYILSEKNRIIKQSLWEKAQGIGVFK